MNIEGQLSDTDREEILYSLHTFQEAVGKWAQSRGFQIPQENYDPATYNYDQKLLLIVSEVVEAQEELRHGHHPHEIYFEDTHETNSPKPCGFVTELADIAIRLFQLASQMKVDLAKEIVEKHKFNGTRPFRHGKKF